jgi:uncharacterized protein
MKRRSLYLLTLAVIFCCGFLNNLYSQDIPEKPVPPRLVNDFAGMLSAQEAGMLEQRLVAFNDSTSTQIAIVTVPSLDGYAISDYSQRLGEKWGIGKKQLNNGLLILVKPKTASSKGEVFIAQGYGLEGAIPDLTCSDIVNNEILPAFRNGDYYGGLSNAVTTLMSLARGEFTAAEYGSKAKKSGGKDSPVGLFIFIIIVVLVVFFGKSGGSNNRNIGSGGLPFWMLMSMMNSGRGSHSGSWGGFSGGGGGGGGFGGFGGGSFGGGGAGGSW